MGDIMKIPYNYLTEDNKKNIIEIFYDSKNLCFKEISELLGFSERAISRVLKENNINTKRKNRYTLNENYFNNIDTQDKAYILGLLYADGFVGDEHYNNVVLGMKDKDIIEKVAQCIDYSGEIRKGNKGGFENSTYLYIINISSKIMTDDLRRYGLYPNKSLTMKNFPLIPEELERHFIRGYFDGDGSVVLSKNSSYYKGQGFIKKYEYPTIQITFLGTEAFIRKLAEKMNLNHVLIRNTKTLLIKELRISSKKESSKIFGFLYKDADIFLERKYKKWLSFESAYMKKFI